MVLAQASGARDGIGNDRAIVLSDGPPAPPPRRGAGGRVLWGALLRTAVASGGCCLDIFIFVRLLMLHALTVS